MMDPHHHHYNLHVPPLLHLLNHSLEHPLSSPVQYKIIVVIKLITHTAVVHTVHSITVHIVDSCVYYMWCVTGLDWPAGEVYDSLSPSPWSSCLLPLAHPLVAVWSLAEESPQSPAGVVGSASYHPAAAEPVNKAVDHIPCSLYISTARKNVTYSLLPEDVGSPDTVLLLSFCLLINPSSSPLSACPGTLCCCWVCLYPIPSPHSIPHLLPGLGEKSCYVCSTPVYHCHCVHLSLKLL